jgi:hypothetical protein
VASCRSRRAEGVTRKQRRAEDTRIALREPVAGGVVIDCDGGRAATIKTLYNRACVACGTEMGRGEALWRCGSGLASKGDDERVPEMRVEQPLTAPRPSLDWLCGQQSLCQRPPQNGRKESW